MDRRIIDLELEASGRVPATEGTSVSAPVVAEGIVAHPLAKIIPRSKQTSCGRRRRQVRGKRGAAGGAGVSVGEEASIGGSGGVCATGPTVMPPQVNLEGQMQSRSVQPSCDDLAAPGPLGGG